MATVAGCQPASKFDRFEKLRDGCKFDFFEKLRDGCSRRRRRAWRVLGISIASSTFG
jgi:hypothetical protein